MKLATLLKQGISPMFAPIDVAAALVGLEKAEFQELVDSGALPPPCETHGHSLYDMEDIRNTLRGAKPEQEERFEL